jgi:long-chain acyl-CoA synthetase
LYDNACRAAAMLRDRELPRGSRIVIWAANCPEWLAFLFGASMRGLVVTPADADWPAARVAELAAKSSASLLVCGSNRDAASIPIQREYLFSFDSDVPLRPWHELVVPISDSDPAVILYTSGTSSEPRGVVLTHANLMFQATRFSYWKRLTRYIPARLLALSPLSHIQGLLLSGIVPLSLGLTVIHSQSVAPRHLIRTIRAGGVLALSTVPRVLDLLEAALMSNAGSQSFGPLQRMMRLRRLLGWRFLILLVGGATLPRAREKFWRRAGCFLVQGYGSTETAAFVTVNRPFVGRFGSIGKAVHSGAVKISEDGEILVRGRHLAAGYYDGGIQPLELTPDGYFRTGDLATRDRRNRFFFLGRKRDLIVTGEGHNVNPRIVEAAVGEAPGVRDSVVFGMNRNGFEEVHAVLLMRDGESAAISVRHANESLLPFQRISGWTIWPHADFPRLVLGKVDRERVVALARGSSVDPQNLGTEIGPVTLDDIRSEPNRHRRIEQLARYIATSREMHAPQTTELVRDFGLESLDILQLSLRLETEYNLALPPSKLAEDASIADLRCCMQADENESFRGGDSAAKWHHWIGWNPLRRLSRGLLVGPYVKLRLRVRAVNGELLLGLEPPVILAIQQEQRRHFMDYLAIYSRMPESISKKLFFCASLLGSARRRALWGGSPISPATFTQLFFPYTPLPRFGQTRQGLLQSCDWIGRGYSPILTWRPGAALIAAQTHAQVVPVHLSSSFFDPHELGKPEITVSFGHPVGVPADVHPFLLYHVVESRLKELQANDGH